MGEYRPVEQKWKGKASVFVRHPCSDMFTMNDIRITTGLVDCGTGRRAVLGPTDRLRLIAWYVRNNFHGKHAWATKR